MYGKDKKVWTLEKQEEERGDQGGSAPSSLCSDKRIFDFFVHLCRRSCFSDKQDKDDGGHSGRQDLPDQHEG